MNSNNLSSKLAHSAHWAAACLVIQGIAGIARADSLSTDRPDFVESSSVVERGQLQIEFGGSYENDRTQGVETRTTNAGGLLRYGVGGNIELRLETDGYVSQRTRDALGSNTQSGNADIALGVKWHAADGSAETHTPAMAFLLHADLDTGSAAFRGVGVRPSLRMVAEWELGEETSLGVMPGVVYDQSDAGRFWSEIFAVTVSTALSEKVRGFVEIAGQQFTSARNGGDIITYDGGLTYLVDDSLQFDCSASIGANENSPDWSVGVGVSKRF